MSFGSYAESSTLKLALETAYNSSFLVGASGNSKIPIGPCIGCAPHYPAAYNYVLGVEDFVGHMIIMIKMVLLLLNYATLLNYELMAPGSSIMSTIPGWWLCNLTGTSMATPLVAGAMALYNQINLTIVKN